MHTISARLLGMIESGIGEKKKLVLCQGIWPWLQCCCTDTDSDKLLRSARVGVL